MRYLAIYLTPAGALVLLVCFFLPWMVIECRTNLPPGTNVQATERSAVHGETFSGFDLAHLRSWLWGIPISGMLILIVAVSRLKPIWRYRLCLVLALSSMVLLAASYEELQKVNQANMIQVLQRSEEGDLLVGQLPPNLRETVAEALQWVEMWNRQAGVEVAVDFKQPYSITWAGGMLSLISSFVMLLRLARRPDRD